MGGDTNAGNSGSIVVSCPQPGLASGQTREE
jgi:hypothetical protein